MAETVLARMASLQILGRSPAGAYFRLNEWIWDRLPRSVTARRPVRSLGHLVHSLVLLQDRRMHLGTFFLRNRPELELIGRLSRSKGKDRAVKIAILGPSNGAEVYSVAWAIRSAHPEVELRMEAVDLSAEVVEAGQKGVYQVGRSELVDEPIFDRMTAKEMEEMFDRDGDSLRVKPWIKEGIGWRVGDAANPGLAAVLGPQDIVVANRFLCHMRQLEAEECLRNIARLVAPGGHLFVSGVDLDLRTKVATALGWKPVRDLLEEIHEGDPSLRKSWPHRYWGLEPIDKGRPDWIIRYASVFQLGGESPGQDGTTAAIRQA